MKYRPERGMRPEVDELGIDGHPPRDTDAKSPDRSLNGALGLPGSSGDVRLLIRALSGGRCRW
jgi:hypothetical protein